MRTLAAAVLVVAALVRPDVAHAHGGRPQTYDVLFGASDLDMVVPGTFGVMATRDGGAHWDWLCIEGMPDARRGSIRPAARTPSDAVLFAQSFGLVIGADRACGPAYETTTRDRFVVDVTARTGGGFAAITSDAGMANHLFVSADGSDPFTSHGDAFPDGLLPERVRYAPSDPLRVYVSGETMVSGTSTFLASLLVSRDGGLHWTAIDVPLAGDENVLRLLAVDPADPDHFFLVAQGSATDRLIEGRAGGATLADVVQIPAAVIAANRPFALGFASDGAVWLGNTMAGLYRILPGDVPQSIDKYLHVACVVPHGDDVYLCGDGLLDAFALGVQHPGPDYAPVALMQFDQLTTPRTCGTAIDAVCAGWWNDLLNDTGRSALIPDAASLDAGVDASASDAAIADAGTSAMDASAAPAAPASCGCRATTRGAPASAWLVLSALALARARRRWACRPSS